MDCKDCNGACCRWLFINFNGDRSALKFLKVRGAKELSDGRLAIPSKCPMLGEKTGPEGDNAQPQPCLIYESRPLDCRVFKAGSKECLMARKLEGYDG